jgi:cobalt-zinc-cadmium efflux system protein
MVSAAEGQSKVRAAVSPDCLCGYLHLDTTGNDRTKTRVLSIAMGLLAGFFVIELGIGYWSHSLSLLADAGHLLSDVGTLGLTLAAAWLARRPAADRATFGYHRAEILAALINGVSLVAIAVFVTAEAIERLQSPEPILILPMLAGASLGLVVNGLNILLLHNHSHSDLNLRGAFLHIVADAASSVGIIIAALMVYWFGWTWVDAAAGLVVACLTCLSAIPLIKSSLEVLMEFAPKGLDPIALETTFKSFDGVEQVDKLYVWTLTSGRIMVCANLWVTTSSLEEQNRLLRSLQSHLHQEFSIYESVLQLSAYQPAKVPLHPLFNQSLNSMFSGIHDS